MIRVVHPGSRILMLTFSHPGSRIQGSKRYPIPDPGSGSATLAGTRIQRKIYRMILTGRIQIRIRSIYSQRHESRIQIQTKMSWIPDHGVQRAPDPDPQHWITASSNKCNQCGGTGIRDVYPGSDFFPSELSPSRIPDPHHRI
jgi:hypothetical protein